MIRRRNPLRSSAIVLTLAVLAAACGTSTPADRNVYRDPADRLLFELPDDWHLYDADALAGVDSAFIQNTGNQLIIDSMVGFDGAPGANVANLSVDLSSSPYPIGAQLVRRIGPSDRDVISRNVITGVVFDFSTGSGIDDLFRGDYSFGDGYDGVRRQIAVTDAAGNVGGIVYLISVTDAADSTLYSIAAGCSLTCWNANEDDIVRVVDSWLVNTSQ